MVGPARMGWHDGKGMGRARWGRRLAEARPHRPVRPVSGLQRYPGAVRPGVLSGNGVLIVEDDAFAREAMAQILRGRGYAAITAASGREALRRLRGGVRPALILLDLRLPDGWELCRQCQRDSRLDGIPVVVLTAGEPLAKHQIAALRVAGHLQKPLVLDHLLATVALWC